MSLFNNLYLLQFVQYLKNVKARAHENLADFCDAYMYENVSPNRVLVAI